MNDFYSPWPYFTLFLGVISWLFATRLRFGSVVSPFSTVLLMLIAIFGIRPILMMQAQNFNFYGINIRSGVESASIIGFVAVLTFIAAYGFAISLKRNQFRSDDASRPARTGGLSERPGIDNAAPPAPHYSFSAAIALVLAWFASMIVLGGGIGYLRVLFAGRSSDASIAFSGVPAVVLALPVVAAIVLATTRFKFERHTKYSARQNFLYWLVGVLCIVPPSALGNRRFLIPSLIALVIGALAVRWRRRIPIKWIVLSVAGFLALAIFPFVRSAGSRTGSSDLIGAMSEYFGSEGISGTLNGFFLSYDTEMFNYIAYLAPRLGETLPYGMGRGTVGELLVAPIPAAFTPYTAWSNELLVQAFGGACGVVFCPVPSVVGTFYYDLALPGVVAGMLLLGLLTATFEQRFITSTGLQSLTLLALAGFAPVIARGNPIAQLWIVTQVIIVAWIVILVIDVLSRRRLVKLDERELLNRSRRRTSGAAVMKP